MREIVKDSVKHVVKECWLLVVASGAALYAAIVGHSVSLGFSAGFMAAITFCTAITVVSRQIIARKASAIEAEVKAQIKADVELMFVQVETDVLEQRLAHREAHRN